jgi:hypothetical protein
MSFFLYLGRYKMSILPPTPIVKSKILYLLKQKLEQPLLDEVLEKLKPFPVFRLKASFRSNETTEKIQFSDDEIISMITGLEEFSRRNSWDCIDQCLNMYRRLKDPLLESLCNKKGVVTRLIEVKMEGEDYSEMFQDEDLLFNRGGKTEERWERKE